MDSEEWCLVAREIPEDLDVANFGAWVSRFFPEASSLMVQPSRCGNELFLSFKSLLLAELLLDACTQRTSFNWTRAYSDPALESLKGIRLPDPSAFICLRGLDESNDNALTELIDDDFVKRTWRLPRNEVVIQLLKTKWMNVVCYKLRNLEQDIAIWRSSEYLPSIIRGETPRKRIRSPVQCQEKKIEPSRKRFREADHDDHYQADRNVQRRTRVKGGQENLVLRRLREDYPHSELVKFFNQWIPGSGICCCRVVPTKERSTVILELGSEAVADTIMDEYLREPSVFRGFTLYRDRAYVRPGSVNKHKGKPSSRVVEEPEQLVVEGFSSRLQHPELKGSLCELFDRVFAGNSSITECGASLMGEFYIRQNRAYVTLSSAAAAEALVSMDEPLFLGGRCLQFGYARERSSRGYDYYEQPEWNQFEMIGRRCESGYRRRYEPAFEPGYVGA